MLSLERRKLKGDLIEVYIRVHKVHGLSEHSPSYPIVKDFKSREYRLNVRGVKFKRDLSFTQRVVVS